jgi:acetyltransferase-like isoleucine patch superfamily enzyme
MSAPSSVKLSATIPVDPRIIRKNLIGILIQIWVSLIPTSFLIYSLCAPNSNSAPFSFQYFISQWITIPIIGWIIIIPLFVVFLYYFTLFWVAFLTKIHIGWLNLLCKPKEGLFKRSLDDRDYVFWNKRNMARIFLFWLIKTIPFPWGKSWFGFRFFGIKVGKNCSLTDCWITSEFIEIGNNVKVGQGSCVYSFMLEPDKILISKVVLEDDTIIGPRTTVFAGTRIQARTILSAGSFTMPFQVLEPDSVYFGNPAELIRKKEPDEL